MRREPLRRVEPEAYVTRELVPGGGGRALTIMVAPDDTAAAGQRRAKRAQPESPSAGAAIMSSPRVAPAVDAEPLDAVAGAPPPPQAALACAAAREEPPCLRDHLLPMLNLPPDLPAHFIGEKVMRCSDVQQRLSFLGGDGSRVLRHLLDVLTRDEEPSSSDHIIIETGEGKRMRMETMEALLAQFGGLPVKLVNHRAGGAVESQLLRLQTSGATVIIGRGYLNFVQLCGFKERDVVEIWAFRGTSTTSDDSSLHVLIAKKDEQTLCSHCSLPMCSHS